MTEIFCTLTVLGSLGLLIGVAVQIVVPALDRLEAFVMGDVKQLDLLDALAARDTALESVQENSGDWVEAAVRALEFIPIGEVGTGEDFRFRLIEQGIEEPHHHNVWGAMMGAAVRKRLFRKTGEYRPMRGDRSHGRMTPVYVRAD